METEKKILVTGGLGYIGSHTVVELIEHGFQVVIVDNLVNSKKEVLESIFSITGKKPEIYYFDIREEKKLEEVFHKENISSVIHFAAFKAVGESQEKALDYYLNNINSLTTLLNVMKKNNVEELVFSSSCTVYGASEKNPVDENEPIKTAESVYGQTKIMGERIIEDICRSNFQLKSIVLRYFNPVGAHSTGLIGENPNNTPNNLFPIILDTINQKREDFSVFGKDYNTPDGTAIRDYIHVVDLAKAHIAALKKISSMEKSIDFINIGTSVGYSVLEIVNHFEKHLKSKIPFRYESRRSGDIEKIWADNTKAKNVLNWEPIFTLDEMVSSSLKWNENKTTR